MSKDNKKIEDNPIQESTRTQLSKLDEHRTKLIDTKISRNKTFAIVSGAVAAMSATTVIGNLFTQNYQVSAQNTGTLIAMIAYSIGNYLMYKKATEEKAIVLSNPEEEINMINLLKNKLELLKNKLEYNKIQRATMATAGAGFLTSFAASFFMQASDLSSVNTLAIIGSAMAGAVGVGAVSLAKKQKSMIGFYAQEIADTERDLAKEEKKLKPTEEVVEQPVQKTLK